MKQAQSTPPSRQTYENHPAYRVFLGSLKTQKTKYMYATYFIKYYLNRPENQGLTLTQILSKSPKEIEYELIAVVEEMKNELQLSYASVKMFINAATHFFEINDVVINKKKIGRFKGENITKYEYRSYTHEEIAQLLSICTERDRAAVLLMASTGMRVGALPGIRLKHLRKWTVETSSYHIYQITVYADSPKDKYFTFCTPEAAKAVDDYLLQRQRCGDNIQDPNAFLFIHIFDQAVLDKRPIKTAVYSKHIIHKLKKAGLRERVTIDQIHEVHKDNTTSLNYTNASNQSLVSRFKHEVHPCHSLRIFCVTNLQRAKVDKTIREMLVGHSTGLDKAYYKPQDSEILEEYLKAVDHLTINNEFRLKKQLDYYKYRQERLDQLTLEFADLQERMRKAGL